MDVSTDRLDRTLDLVTEANVILAASFDVSQTLPELARRCVPSVAEYCAIHAQVDGEPAAVVYEAGDRNEDMQSIVVSPMTVDSKHFGTMTFSSREAAAFDRIDRKIFNWLAMRVAISLHTVGTFTREHRVADRLQRALLPQSFPEVAGMSFGGAYRPAGAEAAIGGDWYDAFALPDGRIAISIGDVAGHGLEAAVIMGEVRQALRAAAVGADKPSAVLDAVNDVINLRESISMVTAIFGFYDPLHCIFRYAAAGHPSPIIATPDGYAQFLPGGGMPLGASDSVGAPDWTFTLPPGAQVVLYTDGMIEYDRDLDAGEERLLEAVCAELAAGKGGDPAKAIQERIFRHTANKDDAATLTLTRSKTGYPNICLVFSALPLISALVRSTLRQLCATLSMDSDLEFDLLVAVGEAIANAVEHAYGDQQTGLVEITTHHDDGRFTVRVDDFGRWRPFVKRDERGRGIPLMHALVDGVQIKSTQTSTSITLTINLKRDAVEPA